MTDRMGSMDPAEIAEALADAKDELVRAARQAGERLEIDRRMREDPWLVLGVAAGLGFVLGGGLWPTLRPLLKAAGRAALTPANLVAVAAAMGAMRAAQGEGDRAEGEGAPTAH